MKIVAETTGNFMLWGGQRNEVVEADRACVVHADQFWDSKVSQGQLTIHGRVNMDITDEQLQKALKGVSEKDRTSVIEAFAKKNKFDPDKKIVEEPTMEQQIVDAKTKLVAMKLPDSKASAEDLAAQEKVIAELEDKQLTASRPPSK